MYSNTGSFAEGYAIGRDTNGGNNGGFGWGQDWIWIIVVLAVLFGWGGNGNWGGNGSGAGTTAVPYIIGNTDTSLQRGFDTQSILSKLDGITNGLCDGFYAMNTSMLQGFNGVDNAVCTLGYQTQQGINTITNAICDMGYNNAQLANNINNNITQARFENQSCCCATDKLIERGFADTNYNMATNTCAITTQMANNTRDIIDSQNAGTRAILDYLCQDKISTLQAENQNLKLAASQTAQNQFITQVGADIVNRLQPVPVPAYPACPVNGYGYNTLFGNSGCNSCCGCN